MMSEFELLDNVTVLDETDFYFGRTGKVTDRTSENGHTLYCVRFGSPSMISWYESNEIALITHREPAASEPSAGEDELPYSEFIRIIGDEMKLQPDERDHWGIIDAYRQDKAALMTVRSQLEQLQAVLRNIIDDCTLKGVYVGDFHRDAVKRVVRRVQAALDSTAFVEPEPPPSIDEVFKGFKAAADALAAGEAGGEG